MVSKRARSTNSLGNRIGAIQQGVAALEASNRTPAPETGPDTLERLARRLELLESANYRYEQDIFSRGSDTVFARLDPFYVGPGPARVTFLDGTSTLLSDTSYQWVGQYRPWGNRTVVMQRLANVWHIAGHANHTSHGGKISLEPLFSSKFTTHNKGVAANEWQEPRVQRLSSGIVVLSGLVYQAASLGANETIFTLPVGCRPDSDSMFLVNNSDRARSLRIKASGEVTIPSAVQSSNDFISLDGVAFPAAGVATWTNITTWQGSWGAWSDTSYGTPGYWKDPFGVVWFRGLVTNGSSSLRGDNIPIFQLPATHVAARTTHNPTTSNDTLGYVSVIPTAASSQPRQVVSKTGNPDTTGWLSLSSIRIVTPDAKSLMPWFTPKTGNGWVAEYNTDFPRLAVVRRPDGLAMTEGMVSPGSSVVNWSTFGDWIAPEKKTILPTVGADDIRRFDLGGLTYPSGDQTFTRGGISASGTHSIWTSLDGLCWMVGD